MPNISTSEKPAGESYPGPGPSGNQGVVSDKPNLLAAASSREVRLEAGIATLH